MSSCLHVLTRRINEFSLYRSREINDSCDIKQRLIFNVLSGLKGDYRHDHNELLRERQPAQTHTCYTRWWLYWDIFSDVLHLLIGRPSVLHRNLCGCTMRVNQGCHGNQQRCPELTISLVHTLYEHVHTHRCTGSKLNPW